MYGQFRTWGEFPIHTFDETVRRQWHQAVLTDNHRRLVCPSTGRLWLQTIGPWYVLGLSLTQVKCPSTIPHLWSLGRPTGRRLVQSIDTAKVVSRQPLGPSCGPFCGALGKSYLDVSNVNMQFDK